MSDPSFGHLLRGLRLRFGWSGRHHAFIRMTEVGEHSFRIDVCSGDRLPSWEPKRKHEQHAIWYDKRDPDTNAILDACAPLKRLADAGGLKESDWREYTVGEDGEDIGISVGKSVRKRKCPACNGEGGWTGDHAPAVADCKGCNGTGLVT